MTRFHINGSVKAQVWLLLVAAALLGAVVGLEPQHLGAQAVVGNRVEVPGLEVCSYLLGPTEFRYAAEESWTRVSAATEAVAQIIRPVIVRSSPLLPAIRINFIDEHIFSRIEQSGMEAAALSSDTEFLRRVTLDLTGRIPDADTVVAFVADTNGAKRDALIDGLAVSPEYVDRWTMFFGDLFRLNGRATNVNRYTQGRDAFYLYLKDAIAANKPYDQLVREMITATGDNHTGGAANFPVGGRVPGGPIQDTYDGMAVQAASMFLGIQVVDCLLCHDGAGRLDTVNLWGSRQTRFNMWGLSSFFANTVVRTERLSRNPTLRRYTVTDNDSPRLGYNLNTDDGNRSSRIPVGDVDEVVPSYPFPIAVTGGPFAGANPGGLVAGETRRETLANLITGDIQFARAIVNYIWEELMVEPLVSPSNGFDLDRLDPGVALPGEWTVQPTNPELLEAMAEWFQQTSFDLRALVTLIAKSRTYQLSGAYPTEWKPEYVPYYARKYARRLDAEEIHDAITKATGMMPLYPIRSRTGTSLAPVQWAMQFPDTREPGSNRRVRFFLDAFGRGDRDQTFRDSDGSVLQALNLMNHDFVNDRIDSRLGGSTIGTALRENDSPTEIIWRLYLATLSRFPSDDEVALLLPMMNELGNAEGAESLQWILMNKLDFLFNY